MNIHIKNEKKFKNKMKINNSKKDYKKIKSRRKKNKNLSDKKNKYSHQLSKMNDLLEIPVELRNNKCKITFLDFNKLFIENYLNILKYDVDCIEVNVKSGNIIVNGFDLQLEEMNDEDIMISGKITIVEFQKR